MRHSYMIVDNIDGAREKSAPGILLSNYERSTN